jgi:hypothetical protein
LGCSLILKLIVKIDDAGSWAGICIRKRQLETLTTETHEILMKILELETENCQAVGAKEEVVNCHALRKRLANNGQAF